MLAVNLGIEFEFRAQFPDQLRIGLENEIDVKAGIERTSHIGKLAFIHLLNLLDFGAFLLKLRFKPLNDFVDRILSALGVKHEQRFVTIFHGSSVGWLRTSAGETDSSRRRGGEVSELNLFIAETKPLSMAHFTASAARSIAESISGFSSSENRPNT
jgi:hypothetical protein